MKNPAISSQSFQRTALGDKIQRLFNGSLDIICSIDGSGRFVEVSPASQKVWGYNPQELVGKPYIDLVVSEDIEITNRTASNIMGGEDVTFFENRYVRKDRSIVPMLWSAHWDSQEELFFCIARDASEKVRREALHAQYEREVKRQNQQMTLMLERIDDGFISLDSSFTITYWNRSAELILGIKREESIGRAVQEVFPEIEGTLFMEQYQKALHKQIALEFESFFEPLQAWYEVRVHPSEEGLSIFFRDITRSKKEEVDRQKQEDLVRNQHMMMSEVLEQMSDGFISVDREGKVLYWNAEEERLSGIPRLAVLGKVVWDIFPGLKDSEHYATYQQLLQDPTTIKKRFLSPMTGRWMDLTAFGTTNGISLFLRDISDQKKAEDEIRKLSLVAKEASNAVWLMDNEKRILWVNEAFTNVFGYAQDEIIGRSPSDLITGPETNKETLTQLHQCWMEKKPFSGEIINYTKKGKKIYAHITCQPIFGENGKVENFFTVQTDVSKLKEIQEQLLLANERFRIASMNHAIYDWDLQTNYLDWGEGLFEILGYESDELQIKQWEAKLHPEDRPKVLESLGKTLKNNGCGYWEAQYRVKNKEGKYVQLHERAAVLRDSSGKALRMIGLVEDISERKRLEAQVLHQQKTMNASVTEAQEKERAEVGLELHDNVNQVLTTVKLYAELCRDGVGDSKEMLNKSITLLQNSINEIRSLSKRLSAPTLGNIRLKDSVTELIDAVAATGKVAIKLDTTTIGLLQVEQPLHLSLYRILQEHMTNILKHSCAKNVEVVLEQKSNQLFLQVSDDGKGFDVTARGAGIGITNMESRAESVKGSFKILSASGKGCQLLVRFPLNAV